MRRSTYPPYGFRQIASLMVLTAVLIPNLGTPTLAQEPALAQENGDSEASAEIETLFSDFLHFARIGKFAEAEAQATTLLARPDLEPLKLLAIADKDKQSIPTLITMIRHTSLSEPAQRILDIIREGEFQKRQDAERIRDNVEQLGGAPLMESNAIKRLQESGEYAIPRMIEALHDRTKSSLWPRIIRALPQIGKPAVNPLVMALNTDDAVVRLNVVWALGEIGYPQAVPYLFNVANNPELTEESRQAVADALYRIQRTSDREAAPSAVTAFIGLANQYYDEHGSVKADPRLSTANVWYWQDGRLTAIPVPAEIYGAVMAMRACEETLLLEPDHREAIALWLAANIRREARLGMDVESAEADAGADADATRDENFPRSIYFSRAAGPEYCHLVLGRAVKDSDKNVALGAIAALEVVAGASSLIGSEDYKQPLAQALRFPDAEVRIKAAIALARALPKVEFIGADHVGHILAEALVQGGQPQYVLVDADADNLNRLAAELRDAGAVVVAEADFYTAMDRARRELPSIGAFILSTDIDAPQLAAAIKELRDEYRFSRSPVVVLTQDEQSHRVPDTTDHWRVTAGADASAADIQTVLTGLAEAGGAGQQLDPETAVQLALRAAEALRLVAVDGRTVVDYAPTIPALVTALNAEEEALRISAAQTLALVESSVGQRAIADVALDENNSAELRIAAFDALAQSAKQQGNDLTEEQVKGVVQAAQATADLTMRTAASQALGALNLTVNEASEIIRGYHKG